MYINSLNTNIKSNPKLRKLEPVNNPITVNKPENIYTINFTGKDKNANQILLLAAECTPYADAGGLGTVTCDMSKTYSEKYKNSAKKDLRIIMPIYNADETGPKKVNGVPVIEVLDKLDTKSGLPLRFELEETGIKSKFTYGVKKTEATLYKVKNPANGVPTYAVYSPAFSNLPKQYGGTFLKNHSGYSAFCFSVLNLLKGTAEKENFNPKILHTNDWSTAFTINALKDMSKHDKFYKDINTVHEVLLANGASLGKITPFPALLHCFEPNEVKKVLGNHDFETNIGELIKANPPIHTQIKENLMKPSENIDSFIKKKENMVKVLALVSDNLENISFSQKNGVDLSQNLNNVIRKQYKNLHWDLDNGDFNPSSLAIEKSDKWFTISPNHYKELLADSVFSSPHMKETFKKNQYKGDGILNRLDVSRYNPEDSSQVEFPFSNKNFETNKFKNKLFIAEQFSQENIAKGTIDSKLINNINSSNIKGYLEDVKPNTPLIASIGRYSAYEKGSDILLKSVAPILDANPEAKMVIVMPDCFKHGKELTTDFVNNVVENEKYKGKVVLVDSYEVINQYVAGADLFLIPSRTETCCMTQFQAMRMGALPIASPTGGLHDGIKTIEENIEKANGFKAPESMMYSKTPVESFAATVGKALDIFKDDKKTFKKLVTNALNYDSSWKQSVKDYHKIYSLLAKTARRV